MYCTIQLHILIINIFYLPYRSTIKLTTLVDFPANGFDMSPHLCGSGNSNMWLKKGQGSQNNTYDLYAVCNHHGQNLHTGHYTGKDWSMLFGFL